MHVLLVEDDRNLRAFLRKAFREEGYAVDEAADGEEALAAVRAHDPDLMLLDIYLPKLSGLDVLNAIRGDDLHTRTIAVSGIPDDDMVRNSHELGAVAFMAKPFDFPVLTEEIAANLVAAARGAEADMRSGTGARPRSA